jgi:transcriptional regulator with XRE-family HTH domain
MPESFGARLRRRREQRQITLSTIAEKTKIKVALLDALERDDVSRWPVGIFGRAFLRAYAEAIGLDPEAVVREFLRLHPEAQFLDGHQPSDRVVPAVNLGAIAELCTALGCVHELHAAAPLVEQAARLLDAGGIIVWTWDPAAAQLTAALAYGYSNEVIAHLPRVARDADNATAAAFRSAETRIVSNRGGMGALAIPLMAPDACVGVLAIELPAGGEEREPIRAVATILAAQLARLIAAGFPAATELIGRISA